jgi:hypothetical protein
MAAWRRGMATSTTSRAHRIVLPLIIILASVLLLVLASSGAYARPVVEEYAPYDPSSDTPWGTEPMAEDGGDFDIGPMSIVVGSNAITNGDFETGTTTDASNWAGETGTVSTSHLLRSSTAKHGGTYAMEFSLSVNSAFTVNLTSDEYACNATDTANLSAWYMRSSSATGTYYMWINWKTSAHAAIASSRSSAITLGSSNSWERKWLNVSAPANAAYYTVTLYFTASTKSRPYYVDDVSLTKGYLVQDVQFPWASAQVGEADDTVNVNVSRRDGTSGAISVDWDVSGGTAVDGVNYDSDSGTLNWADGDAQDKQFQIQMYDNDTYDGANKNVQMTLSNPQGGAVLGTNSSIALTFIEATAPPVVQFNVTSVSVDEDVGTATFNVTHTDHTSATAQVTYTTSDGTALAGTNYTYSTGTLTFQPQDTYKTFTVPITNTAGYGGNTEFTITLSSPSACTIGANNPLTVTIQDDETLDLPDVEFDPSEYAVDEDAGTVTLEGRAWSGSGAIERVDVSTDGGASWVDAALDEPVGTFAWRRWSRPWTATAGEHELVVRATDATGRTQPLEEPWNHHGLANDLVQRVPVVVR